MGRLTGKVTLVVGGGADGPPNPGETLSMGNGRATAIRCAQEGSAVMVADLKMALAEETAAAIRAEGGRAEAIEMDVSREDDCRAAVEATCRAFGTLQLLVNNVGVDPGTDLLHTTTDQFDHTFAVNLRGHFLTMRYAVPEIVKAGGGAIVNVSSLMALRSVRHLAYEATKSALLALSRSAAVAHGRDKVRINTILPGFINSSMVRRAVGDRELNVAPVVPMGRQGTPWEVANAIVFLLSDEASYITGAELVVDGGSSARL